MGHCVGGGRRERGVCVAIHSFIIFLFASDNSSFSTNCITGTVVGGQYKMYRCDQYSRAAAHMHACERACRMMKKK